MALLSPIRYHPQHDAGCDLVARQNAAAVDQRSVVQKRIVRVQRLAPIARDMPTKERVDGTAVPVQHSQGGRSSDHLNEGKAREIGALSRSTLDAVFRVGAFSGGI